MKIKGNTRIKLSQAGWAILGCILLPLYSFGALFPVTQSSSPAGLVSQNAIIEEGENYTSVNPQLNKNGYTFGYWKINGTRQAGADGRSLTQVSSIIQGDSNFTAHYFADNEDTDGDGVKDWFEYRLFGDLSKNPSDDSDGDGFSNKRESELGQDVLIVDFMEAGGIAGRMSNTFTYADTSMQLVTIKSNPSGFVTTSITNKELNASVTTQSLNGATNGSHFAYWTVNGVRQASPNGVASSKVALNVSGATQIIAHYIPSTEDSDGDGVLDWFEMYQFGNLASGPEDDSDGDGFSNKREGELGQEATIAEFTEAGGIAGRISNTFSYADTSMVLATITSNPKGFITESVTYKESNSTVTTQNLNGATNGSHFAYWTINGVRQFGPTGVSQSQVSVTITADTTFAAHYVPITEDTDTDGIMDWFEMYQFGNLTQGPNDDPDGDGYSNKREGELGQEATIAEFTERGGIAGRMSNSVTYYLQVNNPPNALNLSSTNVHANKPSGEVVGIFQPSDPDDPNGQKAYQLSFLDGNGSTDKNLFTISGMNLLSATTLQVGSYSINVRVMDDENASFDKNFTIQAIHDPDKDDDNDGLTYAQEQALGTSDDNADSDGDGFSDGAEFNAGTNPADANSKPNQAPTAIDLNGTSVAENQVAETIVGEFNATDPDVNATITLTFTDGNGSQHNNLFTIDANGTIRTAATFDYETNATALHIRVKATDEHNASLAKAFVITVTNVVEDLDGDGIEDHADPDDDGDGFSDVAEIAYGSDPRNNQSVANQAPTLLDLNGTSVAENSNAGSIIGNLNATDPDANATITLTFTDGNGSQHNNLFALDANGTLRTTETFDYETNATALHIRIKATDEYNASLAKAFVITVTNVVEDLDGDGIEDHYDPDDDGDGFSDAQELAAGTNPIDPASVPNHSPTDIALDNLRVAENRPVGDLVARVGTSDPDDANGTGNYAYALVDGNGSSGNDSFTLDENGTLRTAQALDHESNASQSIRIRVTDEHNASMEKSFVIEIIDLPEAGQAQPAPTAPDLPNWLSEAQPAGAQAPGWYASDWFGSFHRTTSPWLYHADLGWIYAQDDENGGGWIWEKGLGWLWTTEDVYPYLHHHESASWLYFLKASNGKVHFIRPNANVVESVVK